METFQDPLKLHLEFSPHSCFYYQDNSTESWYIVIYLFITCNLSIRILYYHSSEKFTNRISTMSLIFPRAQFDPLVVSWVGTALAVSYAAYLTYSISKKDTAGGDIKGNRVNNHIKKDLPKVVDTVDVEDLGNKSVFCRCWKSKKFPYCDGAHVTHNKNCNDNVGPLIVQKRETQT